jgi:macrolide-specific efflux system membrane fusion protein
MEKLLMNSIKLTFSLLVVILLSACSLLPKEEEVLAPPLVEPAQIEYKTGVATVKRIAMQVNGVGNMVPSNQQNLFYSGSGGRIDQIHVKAGDQVKKGQALIELDTGNLDFMIEQAEIDLKKARLRLDQLQHQQSDKYGIEMARLDIQSVENNLNQMKKQATNARLVAPMNGLITFVTDKERGDHIEAYEDLIQVADPTNLQLLYTASKANELVDVNVGMPVAVTVGGQDVKGEVVQTPGNVPADIKELNPELYKRSLIIRLSDIPEGVVAGNVANLIITLHEKENALTIPKNAFRSANGREYVQVLEDDTKREKDIKKGIVSVTEVEVLEGLIEGDKVILR